MSDEEIHLINQASVRASQRATWMFACALLVFAMSVWVVTRDYDETRQTAKQAHLTSTRNAQSIESISRTQANLAQLYEKTSESLRKVELEQARRGYGN